jgi:hypothetical protein
VIPVTLNAQIPRAAEPQVIREVGALAGMAARAGHHLPGPRVEYLLADGMSELLMRRVAVDADRVDRRPGHGWMVRAVWRVAVGA